MVRFGLILILSIDSVKCNSCYSEYFVPLKSRLCGRDTWVASCRRALNRVMPVTVIVSVVIVLGKMTTFSDLDR